MRAAKLGELPRTAAARVCLLLFFAASAAASAGLLSAQTNQSSPPAQSAQAQPGPEQGAPPAAGQNDTSAPDQGGDDQSDTLFPSIGDLRGGYVPPPGEQPVQTGQTLQQPGLRGPSQAAAPAEIAEIIPVALAPGDARRQQINNECANLLRMANALKAEVDKTSKNELSVVVVRRANQVEQLARKVRDDMRPVVLSNNSGPEAKQ